MRRTGVDQPETPYLETEILLAVLQHDMDKAEAMIREMLPGERGIFGRQVGALQRLLMRVSAEVDR